MEGKDCSWSVDEDLQNQVDLLEWDRLQADVKIEFGTRAKREGNKRFVKLNWKEFESLANHFIELGMKYQKG